MVRWDRSLIERWAVQMQLMAVALLGLAVLMPFVMVPAVIALAVTTLILGPRNVLGLVRRRADRQGDQTP